MTIKGHIPVQGTGGVGKGEDSPLIRLAFLRGGRFTLLVEDFLQESLEGVWPSLLPNLGRKEACVDVPREVVIYGNVTSILETPRLEGD